MPFGRQPNLSLRGGLSRLADDAIDYGDDGYGVAPDDPFGYTPASDPTTIYGGGPPLPSSIPLSVTGMGPAPTNVDTLPPFTYTPSGIPISGPTSTAVSTPSSIPAIGTSTLTNILSAIFGGAKPATTYTAGGVPVTRPGTLPASGTGLSTTTKVLLVAAAVGVGLLVFRKRRA